MQKKHQLLKKPEKLVKPSVQKKPAKESLVKPIDQNKIKNVLNYCMHIKNPAADELAKQCKLQIPRPLRVSTEFTGMAGGFISVAPIVDCPCERI